MPKSVLLQTHPLMLSARGRSHRLYLTYYTGAYSICRASLCSYSMLVPIVLHCSLSHWTIVYRIGTNVVIFESIHLHHGDFGCLLPQFRVPGTKGHRS